jgi:predicted aspartyl protease
MLTVRLLNSHADIQIYADALIDTGADITIVGHEHMSALGHNFGSGRFHPARCATNSAMHIRMHQSRICLIDKDERDVFVFPCETIGFTETHRPYILIGQDLLKDVVYMQHGPNREFAISHP